jgi:hypothetical protein
MSAGYHETKIFQIEFDGTSRDPPGSYRAAMERAEVVRLGKSEPFRKEMR